MERGAWRATVDGVAKNWTRLSDTFTVGKGPGKTTQVLENHT